MREFIDYIFNNKEWIFSGIGVTILLLLARFLFPSKGSGVKKNKQKSTTFTIGGNNKSKTNQKNDQ